MRDYTCKPDTKMPSLVPDEFKVKQSGSADNHRETSRGVRKFFHNVLSLHTARINIDLVKLKSG